MLRLLADKRLCSTLRADRAKHLCGLERSTRRMVCDICMAPATNRRIRVSARGDKARYGFRPLCDRCDVTPTQANAKPPGPSKQPARACTDHGRMDRGPASFVDDHW